MKILFSIDSLQQGGAEQSIANIIKYFSPCTEVVILYFYPKADLLPVFEQLNCKIYSVGLTRKYGWISGIKKMREILKKENSDIVVTSLYRSNIMSRLACKLVGKRLIGTFVDDPYSEERKNTFSGIGRLKFYFFKWLDRLTARLCYGWISNSKSIAGSNTRHLGIKSSKVKVIYRGRDSLNFPEWAEPTTEHFHFVSIGRLYEKKGYPELLSAFQKLSIQYPNARLTIYGEGAYRPQMEAFIRQHGLEEKIKLTGNVPDAWKKIYDSHCFVFPSRFEGFSGALVEAMMTGVPIIASDIPMNTEAVSHSETALVHRLRDESDLLEKMVYMMEHYPAMKEMGKRARTLAIEKYDIRHIARQYEDQLKEFATAQ